MQIEIAKMERMAQTGSSLLRLIQNSHTPILDLLIRESVQNSLDAAQNSKIPIHYDISTKSFLKKEVTKHFTGIEENLNNRFDREEQKSIIIKDSNTTGLTGPLHQDYVEDGKFGNLLKLIYEISMPQEKKEAGGSWGLGKTVYFRVGIGLVVYYSRVKLDNGEYESRLAACLVEDESKEDALLPNNKGFKRGIAWWGQYHTQSSTKPLTNEEEIKEILQDFNIEQYKGSETGTTIIIPFIDSSKLLAKRDNENGLWWYQEVELYLNIALQRWYAPRIDNNLYPYGNYLVPSTNGRVINKNNLEPVFSIIQSLYIAATSKKVPRDVLYIDYKDINIKEIKLRGTFKEQMAGKVAFIKVYRDILQMGVPYNKKSPYEYIDVPNNYENNPPIVTYMRKPAMVVNYETEGKWTNGIEYTNEDEFIIGLFAPNSNNVVTAGGINISLDEYLRQGEKADHSSWSDIMLEDRKHTIIDRIQKKVSTAIKQTYTQVEKETTSRSGALSKSLAKVLLPPSGYGSMPGGGKKTPGGGSKGTNTKKGKLIINNVTFGEGNTLVVDFEINIPQNTSLLQLEVQVDSEGNKKFKGDDWEKESEIGTKFPIEISNIDFESIENGSIDDMIISLSSTKRFGINNKAMIQLNDCMGSLKGKLHLVNYDPMIQSSIHESIEMIKEGVF